MNLADILEGAEFEIGYATVNNFTGSVLPGYGAPGAWMLEEAGRSLEAVVQAWRRDGYRVRIYDAYRPLRAASAMVEWAHGSGNEWMVEQGYISETSRHSLGVAIDLTLVGPDGAALDMGTHWDTFSEASHSANAVGAVAEHRALLRDPLIAAGWVGARTEWWHFSYPLDGLENLEMLDVPYGKQEPA